MYSSATEHIRIVISVRRRTVIRVDLDLLRSGAQVASVLRSGLSDTLDYELHGNLALSIPGIQSMRFASSGTVMVQSALNR